MRLEELKEQQEVVRSFLEDDKSIDEHFVDPSVNLGYLVATHLSSPDEEKGGDPTLHDYVKINVPGDGNCGFYSIAIAILNLIYQDKFPLSEAAYQKLYTLMTAPGESKPSAILEQRLMYYVTGRSEDNKRVRLAGCAAFLRTIQQNIATGELSSAEKFKKFVKLYSNSYHRVLALVITLAPVLRALGVELFWDKPIQSINQHPAGFPILEQPEPKDGVDAPSGFLNLLAAFFDFQLIFYNENLKPIDGSYGELSPMPSRDHLPDNPDLEDKETPMEAPPEAASKTVIRLMRPSNTSHYQLMLPLKEFDSPPYYFGFDSNGIKFNTSDKENDPSKCLIELQQEMAKKKKLIAEEKEKEEKETSNHDKEQKKEASEHSKSEGQKEDARKGDIPSLDPNQEIFMNQVSQLENKVSKLSRPSDKTAGETLIQTLRTHSENLFIHPYAAPARLKEKEDSISLCQTAIKNARLSLGKNQGITKILDFLRCFLLNLGLFILGAGVVYLGFAYKHYQNTGEVGFFRSKPPLAKELSALSAQLETLNKPSP